MPRSGGNDRQRLDKWLWHARMLKTRTLAQKLVRAGAVRVDSERVSDPDRKVGAGNVLTFVLHDRLRVLRILACADRRGPPVEAQRLYEDMSPHLPRRDLRARTGL